MKIRHYSGGGDDASITIQRVGDLYALLNWFQNRIIEKEEKVERMVEELEKIDPSFKGTKRNDLLKSEIEELNNCVNFVFYLMNQAEHAGFGSQDDIENIEY